MKVPPFPVQQIAVGSTNPAKITAVSATIHRIWPNAQITGVAVPSGVSPMPMSDEETIAGARNRARAALEALSADLGVGLEGGVCTGPLGMILHGWVVVLDKNGREGIGGTARLPLPHSIAQRIYNGEELGPVMDDLLGETNVKHKGGAIGALTAGLVLRAETFAVAVAYALSPFIAPEFYR